MASEPADWPTLGELAVEEDELQLANLTEDAAYQLGVAAVEAARERSLPISIGLWRGEHQLFHSGLAGSTADNDAWLQRKGRVVRRFERSSLYIGRLCHDEGTTFAEKFKLPESEYAAAGGAFPLRVHGAGVVGWFGVSGLPQLEDHQFVAEILTAHLGRKL